MTLFAMLGDKEGLFYVLLFLLIIASFLLGVSYLVKRNSKQYSRALQALEDRRWAEAKKYFASFAQASPENLILAVYIEIQLGHRQQAQELLTECKKWQELPLIDEAIQLLEAGAQWQQDPQAYYEEALSLFAQSISLPAEEKDEDKALELENECLSKSWRYGLMECILAAHAPKLKRSPYKKPEIWEYDDIPFHWVISLRLSTLYS